MFYVCLTCSKSFLRKGSTAEAFCNLVSPLNVFGHEIESFAITVAQRVDFSSWSAPNDVFLLPFSSSLFSSGGHSLATLHTDWKTRLTHRCYTNNLQKQRIWHYLYFFLKIEFIRQKGGFTAVCISPMTALSWPPCLAAFTGFLLGWSRCVTNSERRADKSISSWQWWCTNVKIFLLFG